MRLIPCTIKGKPLVLPWGQTPRLDSGVRVLLDSGSGITLFLASSAFASFVVTFLSLVRISSGQEVFKLLSSIMNSITDIKCALTRKAFDAFCTKYHIPEEVHPVLPNQNDTMHERPAGKIGLYTRFFDYANFRLPLSSFLVDVLRHFHMDIFAFIHTSDPTKVKIVERERNEDEPLLLQTLVGRTVPLLPIAPDRAESKLEASVDKLFDESGSGNQTKQGGFVCNGRGADIQLVSEAMDTVAEDVAHLQPRRQRKRKTMVVGAGEASHPPKKGEAIPTLPFVTSSVSATPEREGGDHTDSVVGPNLRTISAPQRFVISSDSSHHSGANVAEAEVDSLVRSSVPLMTVVTTITSTVDPALVV
ncbi:hypothetical protein Tco_0143461 [Tanacetum coccineum]